MKRDIYDKYGSYLSYLPDIFANISGKLLIYWLDFSNLAIKD
jgi:hypothetical protein